MALIEKKRKEKRKERKEKRSSVENLSGFV